MDTSELKFEDTNLAMLGSVYEIALRKERANAEPEWKTIKKEPGLYIWRIEKFNVKAWPKEQYGKFYDGDTYIVFKITKDEKTENLKYVAHMWVGKFSSVDEQGTGVYKIVELDDFFDRNVSLVYNAQDFETEAFAEYFKTIEILSGGIESGFKEVEAEKYRPRLLHVRGIGKCVECSEIKFGKGALNSDDVFIFDEGLTIINWRGKNCSGFERFKGKSICEKMKNDRGGKPKIVDAEQGDGTLMKHFKELKEEGNIPPKGTFPPEDMKKGCHNKMLKLSDENGKLEMSDIAFSKDSLNSNDAFLIDRGDNIYVWIGKNASQNEKKMGIVYATKYKNEEKRNKYLPIVLVREGEFQSDIDQCFA